MSDTATSDRCDVTDQAAPDAAVSDTELGGVGRWGSGAVCDDAAMLGDLLGKDVMGSLGLGDRVDPRKMVDLVDELWDSRHQIVDAVDFVWKNRDGISAAMAFVRDHADELLDLGRKLPPLLATAGHALEQAGDGARQASSFILGDGARGGVRDLAAEAADALERCQRELHEVMDMVDRAGNGLAALPFVGDVVQPLVGGAARIGSVADDVAGVAGRLRSLGDQLDGAGGDLRSVGAALGSSGTTLQRLAGPPARPAAKRPPAATVAQVPAKKAAAGRPKPSARQRTTGKPVATGAPGVAASQRPAARKRTRTGVRGARKRP